MRDLEQAAALLEAAERDLSALRAMGNNPDFADEIFGFHVQQAAEKNFKAWLCLLGDDYPYEACSRTCGKQTMINRVSCGNARLGELGKGAWCGLNPGELRSLRKIAGLLPRGEKKTLGGAV